MHSLIVHDHGSVTLRVTRHLGRQLLPELVAEIVPGDVKRLHRETWRPIGARTLLGQVGVSTSGGLGSSCALPVGSDSELRSTIKVEVKILLVGGILEQTIGADVTQSIPELLRFTTTGIDENP